MMDLPFKIICTDFDGTLHTPESRPAVPYELQEMIGELQGLGVLWIVNTGRDLPGLLAIMEEAGLTIRPDYMVVVEREIHVLTDRKYVPWTEWNERCHREQQRLFGRIRERLPELVSWIRQRYQAYVYQDDYSPFCLAAATNADTDAILAHLSVYFQDEPELTVVRNDVYARFSHIAYNKGTALEAIRRKLGLETKDVLVAGDHYNDLAMLSREYARWLVAPANAIEEVKSAVMSQEGYVSEQSCGHGVADGLRHFLNGRWKDRHQN
jgi:HAD superfamily hydrolase (TIGR01484 family)